MRSKLDGRTRVAVARSTSARRSRMYRALTAEQARAVEERAVASRASRSPSSWSAAGAAVAREVAASACPRATSSSSPAAATTAATAGSPRASCTRPAATCACSSLARPDELAGLAARLPRRRSRRCAVERAGGAAASEQLARQPRSSSTRCSASARRAAARAARGVGRGAQRERRARALGRRPDRHRCRHAARSPAPRSRRLTVTFTAPKRGLVVYPGAGYAGEVVVADIGIDPRRLPTCRGAASLDRRGVRRAAAAARARRAQERARPRARGRGLAGYPGAASRRARRERAGAGYVTLAVPSAIVAIAQAHLLVSAGRRAAAGRTHAFSSAARGRARCSSRASTTRSCSGPGSRSRRRGGRPRAAIVARDVPLVVDADALNALVDAHGHASPSASAPTVLTPHPGELGRLLGIDRRRVQPDRYRRVGELAGDAGTVVLKGAGTVISGAGRQVDQHVRHAGARDRGHRRRARGRDRRTARAGSRAARGGALGAYLHGRAGEAAAAALTPICVTAEDVPEYLPAAVGELLGDW